MKVANTLALLTLPLLSVSSFQVSPVSTKKVSSTALFGYVPDGFTKESYEKFKKAEAAKKKKNLGGLGPRGFKSRSFQSFQEALERGEAKHLMPVMNAKQRVARGELKEEDIPVSFMILLSIFLYYFDALFHSTFLVIY